MFQVKCIESFGQVQAGKIYSVEAEGDSAYTIALPDGRKGFYAKGRFKIVPKETNKEHLLALVSLIQSVQGDLLNMRGGIANEKQMPRMMKALEEAQSLLRTELKE